MGFINKYIKSISNVIQWSVQSPGQYTVEKWLLNNGTISCECAPGWHTRTGFPPIVWWAEGDWPSSLFTSGSFLGEIGNRWRWVVSFTLPICFTPGEKPRYPLGGRLGGPLSLFGCGCREKNFLPLPGIQRLSSVDFLWNRNGLS
jgi:hypothetical protein